jgi:hypothetical protein
LIVYRERRTHPGATPRELYRTASFALDFGHI